MEHGNDRVQVVARKLRLRLARAHLIVLKREQVSHGVENTGDVCRQGSRARSFSSRINPTPTRLHDARSWLYKQVEQKDTGVHCENDLSARFHTTRPQLRRRLQQIHVLVSRLRNDLYGEDWQTVSRC